MVYTIRVYLYANRTKNGGRRLPDVKHECYGKLSVKSVLKTWGWNLNLGSTFYEDILDI